MVVTQLNPTLWASENKMNNSLFDPNDPLGESDIHEEEEGGNNGSGFDNVLDRINGGLSAYERLRCAIKPNAPGCYSESNGNNPGKPDNSDQNQTMLIIGIGVLVLLAIVVVVIALKK